jgi:hypothetical protein
MRHVVCGMVHVHLHAAPFSIHASCTIHATCHATCLHIESNLLSLRLNNVEGTLLFCNIFLHCRCTTKIPLASIQAGSMAEKPSGFPVLEFGSFYFGGLI